MGLTIRAFDMAGKVPKLTTIQNEKFNKVLDFAPSANRDRQRSRSRRKAY